ncbi:MAG: carboxypeptidase-like regulatory domain-containing protein [Tannerella sp.]|nr:carboxypeptidase-like regulatory domain-containing protein [Tannerella sp.]
MFFLLLSVLLSGAIFMNAQESAGYITVSGTVKDFYSRKAVEHVSVTAVGTRIGTVTNEDGVFTLKLPADSKANEIELSCLGYYNTRIRVSRGQNQQTCFIKPQSFQLSEVEVFSWQHPRDLIKAALSKLELNYSMNPNLLTGFYRETIQKRHRYIHISEAVVRIYKNSYRVADVENDRIQVLKGRKLVSPKPGDTLNVKFLGGPNMAVYMDVVKNPDLLLSGEALPCYSYRMGEATSLDDRLQYVVHFQPQVALPVPLYSGTFYIDRETLAFTRAEFSMDMKDRLKVISVILKDKPSGLRFSPEEVSYVVTYRQHGGRTYLNYIRNEIRFKCDWRRRLFATNYTIVDETVITDSQEENIRKIPAGEAFSIRQSLSQEVSAYFDDDFWGAYNIIEPAESLENAVGKLKKQQRRPQ